MCDPDLLGFDPAIVFNKIRGNPEFDAETAPGATGDVIQHFGMSRNMEYNGKPVKVELLPNPSHLEVSN